MKPEISELSDFEPEEVKAMVAELKLKEVLASLGAKEFRLVPDGHNGEPPSLQEKPSSCFSPDNLSDILAIL